MTRNPSGSSTPEQRRRGKEQSSTPYDVPLNSFAPVERSWDGLHPGLSHDFVGIGWNGACGFLNHASGDTDDSGDNASTDQAGVDITLDFKPPTGVLQGFWLSARTAFVERELEKTDLATFAFGMIVGTLLGLFTLALGNVSIGLGTAGRLLTIWIIIGYLGSVMPTFGRVPAPARFVLMELAPVLFMAAVGLNAGGGVVEALTSVGPIMIAIGVLITLLPAFVADVVDRQVLGMSPALLLGSITGAMASPPRSAWSRRRHTRAFLRWAMPAPTPSPTFC